MVLLLHNVTLKSESCVCVCLCMFAGKSLLAFFRPKLFLCAWFAFVVGRALCYECIPTFFSCVQIIAEDYSQCDDGDPADRLSPFD